MEGDVAERMYPNESRATENQGSSKASTKLEKTPPTNPYNLGNEIPDDDVAERMYAETDRVNFADDTVLDEFAYDEQSLKDLKADLGYMASEMGADADSMKSILEISRDYSSSMSDNDMYKQKKEVEEILRNEIGVGWKYDLSAANDLVKSFPEFSKNLRKSGMGNDIRVIREFIRLSKTHRGSKRVAKYRKIKGI